MFLDFPLPVVEPTNVSSINLGKTRSLSICKRRRKQVESRAEGGRSGFDHPLLSGIRGTAQKRHGRT